MSGVNEIRSAFLDYFQKNRHEVVASSPLVPRNDPSLMFTNAGMVQFKNLFTGMETAAYQRATSSQKCVRAGGKHNDLDNVGYTARHHTFFEMLGNFSFGDYFKEQAIFYAWEFLTRELNISPDKLIVTVFAEDEEAHGLWRKLTGFSDNRIIRIGTTDNFWSMGDAGPCGPCSEIFFDHGSHIAGGPPGSPDEDGDRFVEIWNLVFMQFEQFKGGERTDLAKPSIDTGMGLERVAAVLQGTHDNYETDLFRSLISAAADFSKAEPDGPHKTSLKVIADHLRSTSFLIADGVLPSNEGRGYVLRRIMRRAMRHSHIIGNADPVIYKLVPSLVREMGQAYPELVRAEALITETLQLEEVRFKRTLERGLTLLETEIEGLKQGDTLEGRIAFKLYDTYGFPLDLTEDALRLHGIQVDESGFQDAMNRQKAEARKNWTGSGETAADPMWLNLFGELGATEFLGYAAENAEALISAIVVDNAVTDEFRAGASGYIIANQTPFYGESGGQVGDKGLISSQEGGKFEVEDTQKIAGELFVHKGKVIEGVFKKGQVVALAVDHERRKAIKANHSATHLLHQALRETLGDHVAQKGSAVTAERLRFDFSHPKPLTSDEIQEIENRVNEVISQNNEVLVRSMGQEEAVKAGALALFGEKYGDEVRVVSMGLQTDGGGTASQPFSVELCGGTHVERIGDIAIVKVLSESAVAAGVRRIEAMTGGAAREFLNLQDERVREAASLLKTTAAEVIERLQSVVEERKKLEKELVEAKRKLAMGGSGGANDSDIREIGPVRLLAKMLEGVSPKDLRGLVDEGKSQLKTGIVAFIAVSEEGKAALAVGVTKDLTSQYNAVEIVKAGAVVMGGKGGGGRPDMAQAGGPDGEKAVEALTAIEIFIGETVGAQA